MYFIDVKTSAVQNVHLKVFKDLPFRGSAISVIAAKLTEPGTELKYFE